MNVENARDKLANYLAFGLIIVTLLVVTGSVTDPVNAPKLVALGGVSFGTFFIFIFYLRNMHRLVIKLFALIICSFIGWAAITSIMSSSPFSQNFYGLYGRNSGLLTYIFLGLIALVSTQLQTENRFRRIVFGFLLALAGNLLYCTWVVIFGDFIGWENPYGAILGTFGNPNFVSAFLGMGAGPIFLQLFRGKMRFKIISLTSLLLILFLITRSDSLQGIVVFTISLWLAFTFYLKNRFAKVKYVLFSLCSGIGLGIVAIFGALGRGPLVGPMSQPTVALREQYWFAAWKMALDNPIFGVGMDSYGDWYRRSRGLKALVSPGAETVTNAAHNVFLDILAYGGFPLFFLYCVIMLAPVYLIVKDLFSKKDTNFAFATVSIIHITYLIQSTISINQIGIAIWGWVSAGLIVGWARYDESGKNTTHITQEKNKRGKPTESSVELTAIMVVVGASLGILIACPPIAADMKWVRALKSQQFVDLESAISNQYFSPINSSRMAQVVQTLERSNLPDLALKYALSAVEFNPQSALAWQTLYFSQNASQAEKNQARKKLIELDPLNSKWKELS